jgi:hypothetical protein
MKERAVFLELVKEIVTWHLDERISPVQALNHRFITEIGSIPVAVRENNKNRQRCHWKKKTTTPEAEEAQRRSNRARQLTHRKKKTTTPEAKEAERRSNRSRQRRHRKKNTGASTDAEQPGPSTAGKAQAVAPRKRTPASHPAAGKIKKGGPQVLDSSDEESEVSYIVASLWCYTVILKYGKNPEMNGRNLWICLSELFFVNKICELN